MKIVAPLRVYTHNQLFEFVWCGTRGYNFGTCGNLVVVYKAGLVLALVQTQNFGCVFGLRPSKTKCLITKYL